jgi:HK97 family phage portal protein
MSKKRPRGGAAPRDRPVEKRSLVWLGDWPDDNSLACAGYTTLAHNPEVATAVDTIARLIGAMTIHLMQNTPQGDVRIQNGLSRVVDINPNRFMTRSNFIRWIVRTMLLEGNGNAVVMPVTNRGYLEELVPIPPAYVAFIPAGLWDYRIAINGDQFLPEDLLHFAANPGDLYPWLGTGYRVTLASVADNLKQAAKTENGFMSSKWKPSLIVKVDALTDEFSSPSGRRKLLEDYAMSGEAGEPWLIPAEQFSVEQVKPLTLSDLALSEFVKLDKQTVASILGVPPFVLGVGEFKRDAWNSFVSTTIMPIAQGIQQELTRKLLYSSELYFRFNPRSLMNYELEELVKAGAEMVDRIAMRRNEWRDWMGLPPDPDMNDLIALENYLPADRLGDQKKLTEGGET